MLRALQTSRVHPWLDIRLLSMNQFFHTVETKNELQHIPKMAKNL